MPTNDNDAGTRSPTPYMADAYGRAALLLGESLIHGLREKSLLSVDESVDVAERAVDVQRELLDAADETTVLAMSQSRTLLAAIAMSLQTDRR